MAKFCAKWRAEQLPVYFLSPNGEDFVFGLFGYFQGIWAGRLRRRRRRSNSGFWPGPSPHAQGWNKPQGETPRSDIMAHDLDRTEIL